MIKETKKITKYNRVKTSTQIFLEYLRTVGISVLAAFIITSCLAYHARQEMISSFETKQSESVIDKKISQEIIQNVDLLADIETQPFSLCMQIGTIYENAEDYASAQIAYQIAMNKAPKNNYKAHYKMICILLHRDKLQTALSLLDEVKDKNSLQLVKFKSKSHIAIGDKCYKDGKFLSAAEHFESALFYYNKLKNQDKEVVNEITKRLINSYIKTADIMVKSSRNSDAIRFLEKARKYAPDDYKIKYKLAIVLSDLDPEKAVEYLDELLDEIPQKIDYEIYGRTLIKASQIADLDGRPTKAKYYRYRIHSIDLFVDNKVVYSNDIYATLNAFSCNKQLFTYPLKFLYEFSNNSNNDIKQLYADFVLKNGKKELETITINLTNPKEPMVAGDTTSAKAKINFRHKIFTHKELKNYYVEIYLYKDEKYKTFFSKSKLPEDSFNIHLLK